METFFGRYNCHFVAINTVQIKYFRHFFLIFGLIYPPPPNEITLFSNLRYFIDDSFNIGFTIYESMYDRVLDPQILETVVGGEDDIDDDGFDPSDDWDEYSGDGVFEIGYMSNSADPEIRAMYSNSGVSSYWSEAQSYRRVYGFEFGKVFGKMSLQGEFGSIDVEEGKNPNYIAKFMNIKKSIVSSIVK